MISELKKWLTEMASGWRFVVPFWVGLWLLSSTLFWLIDGDPLLLAAVRGATLIFAFTAIIALLDCYQRTHSLDGRNDDE